MAHAVSFPSRVTEDHRGLSHWMQRTLHELAKLHEKPDADTVHDLRVALRRCRSIAATAQEIDPHPDWAEMRECARKLFRALGNLRDAHVLADWIQELQSKDDPLKQNLLASLAETEEDARCKAVRRAEHFDVPRWKELERSLTGRLRRVPLEGDAAHCLALERLEEAKELHRRALRSENPAPWHALRIGVKRFRYTVESLMPVKHSEWSPSLKRVQDVLGNIHDLDVLRGRLGESTSEETAALREEWLQRIDHTRLENLQTYRQLMLGDASLWQMWSQGFPRQNRLAYAAGRISATRKALDRKPRQSLAVSRLVKSLCRQLANSGTFDGCSDPAFRRVADTAARLTGIRVLKKHRSGPKFARTFLLTSPVPPSWTLREWEQVAWALRFQRGHDPSDKNKRFSRLPVEQRSTIGLLAGLLRLAIALRKCGVRSGAKLRLESSDQGMVLHVSDMDDTPKASARGEKAKALLETRLGQSLSIRFEGPSDETAKTAEPAPGPQLVANSS